jgi:hypothetical protein
MIKFLIVLFAIFAPMTAAEALKAAAACLPDIVILSFIVILFTVIYAFILFKMEE